MTRFERELSGALGAYCETSAEKALTKIRQEVGQGLTTIDENVIAKNRIGRVLMSDMLEKLTYITDAVDAEATTKAREEEVAKTLEEYRRNARPATEEELDEMRAAYGRGRTVVNIITGQRYRL